MLGLDVWIRGDGICTYCDQHSCVCPPDKPPFTRADEEVLPAEADYWEGRLRGDALTPPVGF